MPMRNRWPNKCRWPTNAPRAKPVAHCADNRLSLGLSWTTYNFRSCLFVFYLFCFSVVFWTVVAVQRPSRWLLRRMFFHPLNGTKHGSPPSLTTRDREMVYVLQVRIEPRDLNLRPLTPQSVTLPTLPGAGYSIMRSNLFLQIVVSGSNTHA